MQTELECHDGGCYIPVLDCLVVSDLHVGYPEDTGHSYNTTKTMKQRALRLLTDYTPTTIVVNGDLYHHAPFPVEGAELINDLLSAAPDAAELLVTPGNHESKVGGLMDTDIPTSAHVQDMVTRSLPGDQTVAIHHGHRTPHQPADLHIIGHLHPVTNPDDQHDCYLYGENAYYESDVLILPAFNPAFDGLPATASTDLAGFCPILADGDSLTDYDIIATV